jgi:acetamidase/formamidase
MARRHTLAASPATVHWGYFDAGLSPVLTIDPGDTVEIGTVNGGREVLPAGGEILPEHRAILAELAPRLGSHILTGPIAITGAVPGDVLVIEIVGVRLRQRWAWSATRPGRGALPDVFPDANLWHSAIDPEAGKATLPWGAPIALRPFFGVMGVAPARERGMVDSAVPAEFGGNVDCKELIAGTALHLPVWTEGALFSVGDGHAVQGDGEVCLTALETALSGTFRFTIDKRQKASLPSFATPTHIGTMGFHPDLDEAARIALRSLIDMICRKTDLAPVHAYLLCSLAADLRVTQLVDGNKGIHAMIEKRWLHDAGTQVSAHPSAILAG